MPWILHFFFWILYPLPDQCFFLDVAVALNFEKLWIGRNFARCWLHHHHHRSQPILYSLLLKLYTIRTLLLLGKKAKLMTLWLVCWVDVCKQVLLLRNFRCWSCTCGFCRNRHVYRKMALHRHTCRKSVMCLCISKFFFLNWFGVSNLLYNRDVVYACVFVCFVGTKSFSWWEVIRFKLTVPETIHF